MDHLGHLPLATKERGGLAEQVVRAGIQRPERREGVGQVRVQELEDPLRLERVTKPVLPEVAQGAALGERVPGELPDRMGEEHLAAVASRQEPEQPVDGGHEIIAPVVRLSFSGMQRHPHAKRPQRPPVLDEQSPLGGQGGGDGLRGCREGRLDGVADNLEGDAAVRLDGLSEQGEVTLDGLRHRRSVVLPALRAAFDVGEEEGNRP